MPYGLSTSSLLRFGGASDVVMVSTQLGNSKTDNVVDSTPEACQGPVGDMACQLLWPLDLQS